MSQNKRKKLSLDEARALFIKSPNKSQSGSKRKRPSSSYNKGKNYSLDKDHIKIKISQLERRVMEGNLSAEEEKEVLDQIGKLEEKLK
ncbi:MAG: hypothetical protein ACTSVU_02965 [Promethearchaeota archaeon]